MSKVVRVFFKGAEEDFLVIASSEEAVKKFQKDSSTALVDVVDAFKIFVTRSRGSQGAYDEASRVALENEFGTHDVDTVIKVILQKGEFIGGSTADRKWTSTNDSRASYQ